MTLMRPDKPCRVRGMRGSMVISTQEYATDAVGASVPSVTSTVSDVPCRLDVMSPGEALRYGYSRDESVYRLTCSVRAPTGADIRLDHNQFVTVTDGEFTAEEFSVQGVGKPEGSSGMQTVIVKRRGR